jgi:hypothetical protein
MLNRARILLKTDRGTGVLPTGRARPGSVGQHLDAHGGGLLTETFAPEVGEGEDRLQQLRADAKPLRCRIYVDHFEIPVRLGGMQPRLLAMYWRSRRAEREAVAIRPAMPGRARRWRPGDCGNVPGGSQTAVPTNSAYDRLRP